MYIRKNFTALKVELLNKEIIPYIPKVGQKKLKAFQSQKEIDLLYILSDLSKISAIIDRNLMHSAKRKMYSNVKFSDEGLKDIESIYSLVYSNLYVKIANLEILLKQKHIVRLPMQI
ncbi:MAG: hypothetical protein LBI80_04535 [Endomicrobium sp.]|nr:hypothetical protein [Endomicrobium sp.]